MQIENAVPASCTLKAFKACLMHLSFNKDECTRHPVFHPAREGSVNAKSMAERSKMRMESIF